MSLAVSQSDSKLTRHIRTFLRNTKYLGQKKRLNGHCNSHEELYTLGLSAYVMVIPRDISASAAGSMAFRSGQYYMNFINTLKLFTANIKSFDIKSNCTNLSSSFKI